MYKVTGYRPDSVPAKRVANVKTVKRERVWTAREIDRERWIGHT